MDIHLVSDGWKRILCVMHSENTSTFPLVKLQERVGELLEAKVTMGLPLVSLSPSLKLGEHHPFTAVGFTPLRTLLTESLSNTSLGLLASLCSKVISTCLGFFFKHEVLKVAPTLYEDCFS